MNDTIKTINSLRSIRDFSEKEIAQEEFKIILNSSLKSANASARQSYSMIVIENKKIMKELSGYSGNKMIVYCIDFNRINKTAEYLNQPFDTPHIIDFITGAIDTTLTVQTAVIAARSLGIDTLITNGIFRGNIKKSYNILKLPKKSCFPLISVIFGYCIKEPTKKKGRLNNDTIFHYEKYKDITNDKIQKNIKEYNIHENNLGLIDNWEELGYKNYLDWFFAKWMTGFKLKKNQEEKKDIDQGIKIFYDILEKADFLKKSYL